MIAKFPLCQLCGKAWSEHMHEIDRNPRNLDPSNVVMCCPSCHRQQHGKSH